MCAKYVWKQFIKWCSVFGATHRYLMPSGTTLPTISHLVADLPAGSRRLIIVGDVHGCLHELRELLAKLHYDPECDILVFVGDLVAKGPSSVEVVHYVENLISTHQKRVFSVRGNHEDNTLLAYYYPEGKRGKDPDFSFAQKLSRHDIQFLEQLPLTLELRGLGVRVVHAGWDKAVCMAGLFQPR